MYVIVKFNDGTVKVWRAYDTAWGSPAYEVIGYRDSYKEALALARLARNN